ELHVGVVDVAVELGARDRRRDARPLVARLGPREGEVAANGEVAVDLVEGAAAHVVARLEVDVLLVVEVREGAVAAALETQPKTALDDSLVFGARAGDPRGQRKEEGAHGIDTLTRSHDSLPFSIAADGGGGRRVPH